jgi:methionine-S-sulfoxide reductase
MINKNIVLSLLVSLMVSGLSVRAEEAVMSKEQNATETATFAGGCFWCMESPYDDLTGVKTVTSGYTGGHVKNPDYQQVCTGRTGHAEAVQIVFDPKVISYAELLDVFWHNIDPTTKNRQFFDEGTQYRTAVFYHSDEQKRLAEESKKKLDESGRFGAPIVTEIVKAVEFYPAEEYHQGYCKKKPAHYNMYRLGSGRDAYLDKIWGKDRKTH